VFLHFYFYNIYIDGVLKDEFQMTFVWLSSRPTRLFHAITFRLVHARLFFRIFGWWIFKI